MLSTETATTLSTYIWNLRDQNIPTLNWSIMKRVRAYSNTKKSCPLCLQEKLETLRFENKTELLNKYLLANYKWKDRLIKSLSRSLYIY